MRVTQVVVSQTRQTKPYEPERLELTIEAEERDKVEDMIAFGRMKIDAAFAGPIKRNNDAREASRDFQGGTSRRVLEQGGAPDAYGSDD